MPALSTITPAAVAAILPEIVLAKRIRLGAYQTEVILGNRRLSGADLKGEAQRWSVRYAAARNSALDKVWSALRGTGVDLVVATARHGRKVLEWRIAGMTLESWAAASERPGLAGMVPA